MSSMFEIKDGLEFFNEICPKKDYLVDCIPSEHMGQKELI